VNTKEITSVRDVFVTGGTGYIGRELIPRLLARGHRVRALARGGSEARIPAGASVVIGNALDAESFVSELRAGDTIVHLVGTPHPNPSKAAEFVRVDLASIRATVNAVRRANASHLIYVSVAQPAPVMHAYTAARAEGERTIADAGLTATVLRPWYVLGPGHRWPILLVPLYAVARLVPSMRAGAQRLGLVTLTQMVRALVQAVDDPPAKGSLRVVDVPTIQASRSD
jgi:uncharacterized protein YbjT (DUF2867 family)